MFNIDLSCWFSRLWNPQSNFKEFYLLPTISVTYEPSHASIINDTVYIDFQWLVWCFTVFVSWKQKLSIKV